MQSKGVALRKRTQIAKASRLMFFWVAGVSVVVGFALVGAIFLVQMLTFNEKVISEKNKTIATLKIDNENIGTLKDEVRKIDTNQSLIDSKAKPEDQAIQVILDALPSDANSLALGASLQNRLLAGVSNAKLESLQVDSVNNFLPSDLVIGSVVQNEIPFTFSVSGDQAGLRKILQNLELSIRTIDITSLKIENQGASQILTVQARAFYEPARQLTLKEITVKQ